MSGFFQRILGLEYPSYYPLVPDEIDLRKRLPRKGLNKLQVLNVGVGSGSSGLARQLPFFRFNWLVHVDPHKPYLDAARTIAWDAELVSFINKDVRDCSFDAYDWVLMFDVLEHLPKEDSLKVLDSIKCRQLIFIPLEKEFRANVYEAQSQDHLSLWTEQDFKDRGYHTQVLVNFHKEDNRVFDALWATK
jgi:hypothetical protein